jgi:hypothetical protein
VQERNLSNFAQCTCNRDFAKVFMDPSSASYFTGCNLLSHSQDRFFVVNYPERTGFWAHPSEVPEYVLKLLKLSEHEMTIMVVNLELPFPLGSYTIREDRPSTTLVRLLSLLASHAGGTEYGTRKRK